MRNAALCALLVTACHRDLSSPMIDARPADARPIDTPQGCSDESLEPNNSLPASTPSGVDAVKSKTRTDLAICPTNADTDVFDVAITTANEDLEILVDFTTTQPPPAASILNSGGVAIANATNVTSQQLRAFATNLPTGAYYVQVRAASSTGAVAAIPYTLTINVTGP